MTEGAREVSEASFRRPLILSVLLQALPKHFLTPSPLGICVQNANFGEIQTLRPQQSIFMINHQATVNDRK